VEIEYSVIKFCNNGVVQTVTLAYLILLLEDLECYKDTQTEAYYTTKLTNR